MSHRIKYYEFIRFFSEVNSIKYIEDFYDTIRRRRQMTDGKITTNIKCGICQQLKSIVAESKDMFIRFRSGNGFLVVLVCFMIIWYFARHFFNFDNDNTILNLILSFEASVATCLLLDLQLKTTMQDRKTLQMILDMEKRIVEKLINSPSQT